ncbi:hypothetical protein HGO21_25255 [Acinetobacter sp. CUI P1]|nr:hypothetical protein [Acinetobacter sp. CUI P1]
MSLNIDEIKKSLKSALEFLNIKKVIYIDDAFAESFSFVDAIGTIHYLTNKDVNVKEKVTYLSEIDFDLPKEVWELEIRGIWDSYEPYQKKNLINSLNKIENPSQSEQLQDIFVDANLKKILPTEIEFISISPSQWLLQRETLLNSANQNNKVLCFFDQELKYDEHYASKREGIELLKDTLVLNNENIVCTLITHLTTIESEIDYWKALGLEHSLKLCDFLTLSKRRVDSFIELASGIRLTLLNHKSETLKNYAVEITNEANKYAAKELGNINVYDFYHMVLKSSEDEGVWEAQTLFRIHSIFQQQESQKLALKTETRKKINENITVLRNLIGKDGKSTDTSWEIRRKELFYDESLNVLNLPLQNGDIFEFNQSKKKYILLAQPCDLMIRKNGNRKSKAGLLAEIGYEKPKPNEMDCIIPIPYFDSSDQAFINFKKVISIDLDILELCTYNESGASIFNINEDLSTFHDPLKKRFEKIKTILFGKKQKSLRLIESIEESNIEDSYKQELIDALLYQAFNVQKDDVSVIFTENGINFNINRKGTYRNPHSNLILETYSNYISRDASDHDFAIRDDEIEKVEVREMMKV